MATSIEQITKEIVELPRHQRLTLVRLLLDLDQPGKGGEIEAAWDEEIRARVLRLPPRDRADSKRSLEDGALTADMVRASFWRKNAARKAL